MPVNIQPLDPAEIKKWFDSPEAVPPNTFEFALVLGGTVSAGSYTAGALDFLIEALDAWTAAKAAGQPVPGHNVVLRLIAGTSGGGVNAAIAGRALAYDFPSVARGTPLDTAAGNPFYNTWVNALTLDGMLTTSDLDTPNATPVSLLNGDVIKAAAAGATGFAPVGPDGKPAYKPRPWVAAPLRLILTLTNLNGIAYRIGNFGDVQLSDGRVISLGQSYVDHADHVRFAVVYPGQPIGAPRPDEQVLGFGNVRLEQAVDWDTFGKFARGTAAFPIGFPPLQLTRPLEHYRYRVLAVPGGAPLTADGEPEVPAAWQSLVPDWSAIQDWAGGGLPDDYNFLAVDGGATDNEPIELARIALSGLSYRNPRSGLEANRAVVLIDPFAGVAQMASPVRVALPNLVQALVGTMTQQTRYDTRDLQLAAAGEVFSRFMITALREANIGDAALATAGLGAFIGFACAAFRRHDYLLGRKNCQDFLRDGFKLPADNPLFLPPAPGAVPAPELPIIPLVGTASVTETTDPWPKNALNPSRFHDAIEARFARLLETEFGKGPLSDFLAWLAANAGEDTVANAAVKAIQDALVKWNLA